MACKRCGSWAINHGHHGRDGSEPNLCDVCYWRQRCEQCTASNAAKDAEIARLTEANRYMKGELDDALEDARKYAEAQAEIARLRESLEALAYPVNVSKVDHAKAVRFARAALAPVEVSGE